MNKKLEMCICCNHWKFYLICYLASFASVNGQNNRRTKNAVLKVLPVLAGGRAGGCAEGDVCCS